MLYHKQLGFPKTLFVKEGTVVLQYTKHAKLKRKLFEMKEWPKYLHIRWDRIVEVETEDNKKPKKLVLRVQYNKDKDFTVVLEPGKRRTKVLTLWLNNKGDNHITLNTMMYDIPDPNNSKEIDFIYSGK